MDKRPVENSEAVEALHDMARGKTTGAECVNSPFENSESVDFPNQTVGFAPQHFPTAKPKRMMIPLLMATGIMLIFLASVVAFKVFGQTGPVEYSTSPLADQGLQKVLVWVSYPLGMSLIGGALYYKKIAD